MKHQVDPYSQDSPGLLGALRVARNDNPPWESIRACAAPTAHNASLDVMSGIRPDSLGRLEAAGVSTLIDSALSSGVAVVVDLKCALGDTEPTPERAATEAFLRKAQDLLWVGVGSNLGVSRLVRVDSPRGDNRGRRSEDPSPHVRRVFRVVLHGIFDCGVGIHRLL